MFLTQIVVSILNINSSLMYLIPQNITKITLCNVNMEINKIFIKTLHNIKSLSLENKQSKRTRKFNQNQIKSILNTFPEVQNIYLTTIPHDNYLIEEISKYKKLKKIYLFELTNLSNEALGIICGISTLNEIGFGGKPNEYNSILDLKGFKYFQDTQIDLKVIKLRFITQVGDKIIKFMTNIFKNLVQLEIKRNSFQQCQKITDQIFTTIKFCNKLEKISIIYTRDFTYQIPKILIDSIKNIKTLCLRSCPIFQDLTILKQLIYLQELDMSGDSWIRPASLTGISYHPNIKIFYMGHFDHGQTNCQDLVDHYPPQGVFVENIFKNKDQFKKLEVLYFEQCCILTFWLDIRIKKIRQQIDIRYRKKEQFE